MNAILDPFYSVELQERLWLKAQAGRWAVQRQQLAIAAGRISQKLLQRDRHLFSEAENRQCYLWMLAPHGRRPVNVEFFDMIAACYETLTEAVALACRTAARFKRQSSQLKASLNLVAEAQSALRLAVSACDGQTDVDQKLVFKSLLEFASEERIVISNGMKIDAPVDPYMWVDIAGRVYALGEELERRQDASRNQIKLLGKLKQMASNLTAATEQRLEDWNQLAAVVDELIAAAVPPSRIEFRDAIVPIADRLPSQVEVSPAFQSVLVEIERFKKPSATPQAAAPSESRAAEVTKVAKLLAGKSLVVIGAEGRQEAIDAIEKAFGLKELIWVSTSGHDSYFNFEPYIARSDVAAVILTIRWASHSFGKVKAICDKHGKPLIRLPGGYNPNQIAAAIMLQASKRLQASQSGATQDFQK